MREMQFGATFLMALLTMKLLMLPIRSASRLSLGRSRWLMAAGTGLLAVQFALQYALQLRSTGQVASALMINLAFFIPCSALFALGILYLLRRGHVTALDRFMPVPVWLLSLTMLGFGLSTSSEGLLEDTWQLRWSETGVGVLFAGMQLYYFIRQTRELRELRGALADYYDRDTDSMLSWMEVSIIMLAISACMIPPLLFTNGWWLLVFSLVIVGSIFYFVDSFSFYVAGKVSIKVMAVEQNEELSRKDDGVTADDEENTETMCHVENAVEQWIARGGYLRQGLIQPAAAEEIGVKQYLLKAWLSRQGLHYNEWLTILRIDEAKRIMREHPDWNNESIALHCGFADRSALQRKFKERTGMTPAEFQAL